MFSYVSSFVSKVSSKIYHVLKNFTRKVAKRDPGVDFKDDNFSLTIWRKVGKVESLFVYPVLSGLAEDVSMCNFHATETVGCKNGFLVRNHMFLVYDQMTGVVQTANEVLELKCITVTTTTGNTVTLKSPRMKDIVLDMETIRIAKNLIECRTSFSGELLIKVNVLDCGEKATKWLFKYTGKPYLRLGYILRNLRSQRTFTYQHSQLISTINDHRNIMMSFEDIPSFTLLSSTSLDETNKCIPLNVTPQQLCTNIVISTDHEKPFSEIEWKHLKIGDAIVSHVNPWSRSESQQLSSQKMPTHMKLKKMLLHCELLCPGMVKQDDNVYVLKCNDGDK